MPSSPRTGTTTEIFLLPSSPPLPFHTLLSSHISISLPPYQLTFLTKPSSSHPIPQTTPPPILQADPLPPLTPSLPLLKIGPKSNLSHKTPDDSASYHVFIMPLAGQIRSFWRPKRKRRQPDRPI